MRDKELPIFLCSHLVLWNFHLEGKEKSKEQKERSKGETKSDHVIIIFTPSMAFHCSQDKDQIPPPPPPHPPPPRTVNELRHFYCHQLCSLSKHPCVGSQISRSESSHVWLAFLFRIKMVAKLCLEAVRKIHFQALWIESCLPSSLSQIQNLRM